MEAAECGPACLAMVLGAHGRWESLGDLRQLCGVSRDGSKAGNLLRAARRLGMSAKGFRKAPDQLDSLPRPSIIHWNFNHYVVYEGRDSKGAWINDPGGGRRRVDNQELDRAFTGVVLAFEPGEGFQPGGQPPGLWSELLSHLRGGGAGLLFVLLATLLLVVPGLAVPAITKTFIDEVLIARLADWVLPLLVGLGLAIVASAVLRGLQEWVLMRLDAKLGSMLTTRYLTRLLARPIAFFQQRHPGVLAAHVKSADRVAKLLSADLSLNLFNLIAVLLYGAALIAYAPLLGAIGIFMVVLNAGFVRLVGTRRKELSERLLHEDGRLQASTVGILGNIETLKVGGNLVEVFGRWAGQQTRTLAARQDSGLFNTWVGVVPMLLNALTSAAVLTLGAVEVMQGALSVGGLIAVQTLLLGFSAPVMGLVALAGSLQSVRADLGRLGDVLHDASFDDADIDYAADTGDGRLELDAVSFGYNPLDPPLIDGFSMKLEPGQRVALVGGSGSGKSTIGRLIAGIHPVWSGEVRVDGVAIDRLPPERRAHDVAYVDQEVYLFEGTVRENLTLWDPSVPDDALVAALKDADLLHDIAERPGRLDARVEEGGRNFSGGQRQRLEIARALVSNPALLVLDEATAALDPVTEERIDASLRRRGCSCVIIAHRLSTVRDADEIIVLGNGAVVERGDHAALVARDGEYARLVGGE
ncbi:MAG: NHLP family bacteriocin export ABC transporter peptidase/permease/ATPase subunit [Chromatiaceae bacterium]|nr:NHLP family bacteriocin export ABC transporter peptidase/permease/ATPase subunit [Chromatiaceae bacterium]